jgi:5'-3' exonuclease
MKHIALIDADYLCYRYGFGCKDEALADTVQQVDAELDRIILNVGADDNVVWLSDSTEANFRRIGCPEYKANRTAPRPAHYEGIKAFLLEVFDAQVAVGMEADDALSLNNINNEDTRTTLVSIDKDLLQCPGFHYNPTKNKFFTVDAFAAQYNFYHQLLMGDSTDNIKGIPGVGPVSATKWLAGMRTERELFLRAWQAYSTHFGSAAEGAKQMRIQARLVWLLSADRKCMALGEEDVPENDTVNSYDGLRPAIALID